MKCTKCFSNQQIKGNCRMYDSVKLGFYRFKFQSQLRTFKKVFLEKRPEDDSETAEDTIDLDLEKYGFDGAL